MLITHLGRRALAIASAGVLVSLAPEPARCIPPIGGANAKELEERMAYAAPLVRGAARVLLCKPSSWTEANLVHLSEQAASSPLAERAAASLREQLRPFHQERVRQGLSPPPPITIVCAEEGDAFTARFAMAPGDRQASLLSHALSQALECSSISLEQEEEASRMVVRAEQLAVVLSAPRGHVRCCTLEVTATKATLEHAVWLVARAYALAHTLSMQSDGSVGIRPSPQTT